MPKNKQNWNIAFEISPIISASGGFGDKSGVFRYMYGFLVTLIKELKKKDPHVKIILFTFAPHNLNYGVTPELLELIDNKNVTLLDYKENLVTIVPRYNKIFDFLDVRIIKKAVKILDNIFSLRESYNKHSEKRQFKSYVRHLEKEFFQQKVKTVFHSETGFFLLRHMTNIITVYDLTPILFPELHRPATVDLHLRKIRFAKNQAQMIIAISDSTRADLLSHSADFRKKPIIVAYPGLDNSFTAKITEPKLGVKSKRYLLFYGTFEPRKNITYVVRAFTELYISGEIPADFKLVLIGGKGWGKTKEKILGYIVEQFPLQSMRPIVVLDYATDLHLRVYIKNARAVLYPSLYEGFGLPVLESMALGTPVLTSNTSSLPEVGGDAVLYVNPKDYFDLKNKIKTIISDNKLVEEMSRKGLIQSKKFTWKHTINQVLPSLQSSLSK